MTPLSPDLQQIARLLDRPRPQVVIVVGTGIAIGATGQAHASWLGLLNHGIDYLVKERFQPKWGIDLKTSLDAAFSPSFSLPAALEHAELVEQALNMASPTPAFAPWLDSAFADFRAESDEKARAPLEALRALYEAGALLLTTNYDSLLSDITGAPPVTWEEHDDFHRVMTRRQPGILHIHGHWQRPSSIVLGRSSYDRVVNDEKLQELFRTLWLEWSWIYVGCGDGLDDPNLGRLLEWSKKWGKSGLPDYFLAREDKAAQIAARPGKPPNLTSIGYPSHDDLAGVLRSITPSTRCYPFAPVVEGFDLFHIPGAGDPFPSRQEYLDGDVPTFAADAEVENRLQTHGWACCIDVASVGKTTLALRAATTHEQREHPVFYLDLKNEIEDDPDASPTAALSRLARAGTLLILDNVHYQPELVRNLWRQWNAQPFDQRGRLLLVGTRIHQPVVVSPEEDLTFFEKHPTNPAILLQPTPEDLGHLARYLYRRVGGAKSTPMPAPPAAVLKEWHRLYGAELVGFTFAVLESLADFRRSKWALPAERAAAGVQKRWLEKLDAEELENAICLAAFGAQEFEMLVQSEALPYPEAIDKLLKLGLASETRRGNFGEFRQYGLREPGWGQLILAAVKPPRDPELIRFETALRLPFMAAILSNRLKLEGGTGEWQRLWSFLEANQGGLVANIFDAPLSSVAGLLRDSGISKHEDLCKSIWTTISSNLTKLATATYTYTLDNFCSLLNVAKQHGQDVDLIWDAVLGKPEDPDQKEKLDQLVASASTTSLDKVGFFFEIAKQHGRDTGPMWDALVGKPEDPLYQNKLDRLTANLLETPLDSVGSFLSVAKLQGRDVKPIWDAILGKAEDVPDKQKLDRLAANLWTTPLDSVGSFLSVAKSQGRDVKPIWDAILGKTGDLDQKEKLDRLAANLWATPLDKVGFFLEVAKLHERDTRPVWDAILGKSGDPDQKEKLSKFAASAGVSSLDSVSSFFKVAKEHGQDTGPLWDAILGKPGDPDQKEKLDKLTASAWACSLEKLASFFRVAREHGQDTGPLWDAILGKPGDPDQKEKLEKLVANAWACSLDKLGSFLNVAKRDQREMGPLCEALESDPDRLARSGVNATLLELIGFVPHASDSLVSIALRDIQVGHWNSAPPHKGLSGATRLARRCLEIDRIDLADDILSLVLRRKNWHDVMPSTGGFWQVTWLLANTSPANVGLVDEFVKTVCGDRWLHESYAYTQCGPLAGGLRQLALHQSKERCQQFHHKGLGRRLSVELARFEEASPSDQSQIIQLLGCAALCGWRINKASFENISSWFIEQLPQSVLPHLPEATNVEDYQWQLWLGMRVYVSITRKQLRLPPEIIEQTLSLWRENLRETSSRPTTTIHRINQSMVAWLEDCSTALAPSNEPLWTLTGFPARLDGDQGYRFRPNRAVGR